MTILRLATRQSPLALAQSRWVANQLEAAHADLRVELVGVTTTGDVTRGPLADAGGKGLFTKEVELALLRGDADLAVHSMKDMPVTMPLVDEADLIIAAVPTREDASDALVGPGALDLASLPPNARIGTGSPRRIALLRAIRPDAVAVPVRGNVDTRLAMIGEQVDAVVLAMAGLRRLGRSDDVRIRPLPSDIFTPAAGQGALAVQCRRDDSRARRLAGVLDDAGSHAAVAAERRVVALLDGDCHSVIGAHGVVEDGQIRLKVAFERSGRLVRGSASAADPDEVAARAVAAAK